MILLVLAANSNVVKAREARLKTILIYKLHHLSLKTDFSIGDPEGQAGELIEMICTSNINGEDSVQGDLVDHVAYSGQWESI